MPTSSASNPPGTATGRTSAQQSDTPEPSDAPQGFQFTDSASQLQVLQQVIAALPIGLMVMHLEDPTDPASLRIVAANPQQSAVSGFDIMPEVGRLAIEIYPNAIEMGFAQINMQVARDGGTVDLGEVSYGDDRVNKGTFLMKAFQPVQDYVCILLEDITARKAAEAVLHETSEQAAVIQAQQTVLRELSTPLIPIADGVVVMPLIGTIDSARSQQVIESLLTGVVALSAHTTILDITGVTVVDTEVANGLIRAAQAVKLLGAQVILTGIRPEVAQTLVGLGLDLSGITTRSTLQTGIAEVLAKAAGTAQLRR